MKREYYFDSVDVLVNYILYKFPTISPLKLQKYLYFLFAFYAGTYPVGEEIGVKEQTYNFPNYLFKGEFEAWVYGTVIREVYQKNKNGGYQGEEYNFGGSPIDKEIKKFIDDIGSMVMKKSDFALVDRNHEDKSWKKAITKGKTTPISMIDIAVEYREIVQSVLV